MALVVATAAAAAWAIRQRSRVRLFASATVDGAVPGTI
jgi:hypothetical protein